MSEFKITVKGLDNGEPVEFETIVTGLTDNDALIKAYRSGVVPLMGQVLSVDTVRLK